VAVNTFFSGSATFLLSAYPRFATDDEANPKTSRPMLSMKRAELEDPVAVRSVPNAAGI